MPPKLINQSEGERQIAINAAQGEAEAIRVSARGGRVDQAARRSERASTRVAAEAAADGLLPWRWPRQDGKDAMVQQPRSAMWWSLPRWPRIRTCRAR